ncbi:MAG: acyltransferase [Oscillospiraceae bacterium]|nr:acyltransferase [Oscillospiraceae bacterium]
MSKLQKQRNYGIDLIRLIAMLMVVLLHTLKFYFGLLDKSAPLGERWWLAWSLETLCYCAVNCYALVSGFVSCKSSRFHFNRPMEAWLQGLLYSVGITVLFVIFTDYRVNTYQMIQRTLVVTTGRYWYLTAYIILAFFTPFCNKLIGSITKKQHRLLLLLSFFFFSLLSLLPFGYSGVFATSGGYTFVWLLILYFAGAYLRLYPEDFKRSKWVYLLGYFLSAAFTVISIAAQKYIPQTDFGKTAVAQIWSKYMSPYFLLSYQSPTIIFCAVFLVLFFSRLNIRSKVPVKLIGFFAPAAFGVYLIHMTPPIESLMTDLCMSYAAGAEPLLLFVSILLSAAAVFAVCLCIDRIRIALFNLIHIPQLCVWIDEKMRKLLNYLWRNREPEKE